MSHCCNAKVVVGVFECAGNGVVVWPKAKIVEVEHGDKAVSFPRDKSASALDTPVERLVLGVVLNSFVGELPVDTREVFDVCVCDDIIGIGAAWDRSQLFLRNRGTECLTL